MKRFAFILAAGAALLLASSASAAIVTFQLLLDGGGPGTYELRASSTPDSFGIASYSAQLTDVLTINHISPQDGFAGSVNGNGPAAFTVLRTPNDNPSGVVFASQDTIGPTPNLVYDFGINADSFANLGINDFTGGTQLDQPVWDANLLLATGTYQPGTLPTFTPGSVELFSNVFLTPDGSGVEGSQIVTEVVIVPEPATLALAGLSLIGVFATRRRMA